MMGVVAPGRLLVIVVIAIAAGCGGGDGVRVSRWTLGGEVAGTPGREVALPGRLDVADRAGTYTLTARVELPARWHGRPLTLVVADLPAIARLDVDGVDALATDVPGGAEYRLRGPLGWRIGGDATADGVLDLVLTVDHRWTQSAWWSDAPTLVAGADRPASAIGVLVCNLYLALAAVISLLQIALTSLLVYLLDRKRRAYLWFAVQSALAAVYPLFVLGFTQWVFGIHDAPVLAISLVGALLTSIYFTHEFFELAPPWRGWLGISAGLVVVALVFHGPFRATPITGPVTIALLIVLTGYQLVVCARLARTHPDRQTARIHFFAWVALAAMLPPDVIYWLGLGDPLAGARPASLGLLGMGLCLSLLLGRRHLLSLRLEAEHLERARAEVEQLAIELRRQVAERSAQLFAALSLASSRAARAPELKVGEEVNGRYRIVRELGRGGMGTVYEVERTGDGRRLALKLTHELTGAALARLAREALIASRISHPNLVGVLDVDVAASGFLYVVMELVDGTSLKALRDRHGDPGWALPLLAQTAAGLAALHAAGVVHRDLKPANVLLTGGRVKITDFGVSRPIADPEDAVDATLEPSAEDTETVDGDTTATAAMGIAPRRPRAASPGGLTRTGFLVGTPAYMAPELLDGPGALGPAIDMFAFGVLAWELLTGARPFDRPAAVARMQGQAVPVAPSLATRWAGAAAVVAMIDRCLALDPARRPSAAEAERVLSQDLREAGSRPA